MGLNESDGVLRVRLKRGKQVKKTSNAVFTNQTMISLSVQTLSWFKQHPYIPNRHALYHAIRRCEGSVNQIFYFKVLK